MSPEREGRADQISKFPRPSLSGPALHIRVYPQVVGKGARRSRRFDVARSPTLAEYSKFLRLLTPRRPEGRAPRSRQLADALLCKLCESQFMPKPGEWKFPCALKLRPAAVRRSAIRVHSRRAIWGHSIGDIRTWTRRGGIKRSWRRIPVSLSGE